MGCSSAREKIEDKILKIKLKKSNIKKERKQLLDNYKRLYGDELSRNEQLNLNHSDIIKNEKEEDEKNQEIIEEFNISISKSDSEKLIEKKEEINKNIPKNKKNINNNNKVYNKNYDYSFIQGLGNIIIFKSYNGFQANNKINIHKNISISNKKQLQEIKNDEKHINLIKEQINEKMYNDSENKGIINNKNKDITILEDKEEENIEDKIEEEKIEDKKFDENIEDKKEEKNIEDKKEEKNIEDKKEEIKEEKNDINKEESLKKNEELNEDKREEKKKEK